MKKLTKRETMMLGAVLVLGGVASVGLNNPTSFARAMGEDVAAQDTPVFQTGVMTTASVSPSDSTPSPSPDSVPTQVPDSQTSSTLMVSTGDPSQPPVPTTTKPQSTTATVTNNVGSSDSPTLTAIEPLQPGQTPSLVTVNSDPSPVQVVGGDN